MTSKAFQVTSTILCAKMLPSMGFDLTISGLSIQHFTTQSMIQVDSHYWFLGVVTPTDKGPVKCHIT